MMKSDNNLSEVVLFKFIGTWLLQFPKDTWISTKELVWNETYNAVNWSAAIHLKYLKQKNHGYSKLYKLTPKALEFFDRGGFDES